MSSNQWVRVKELFAELADHTPAERTAKLQEVEMDLRAEVERLLANRDAAQSTTRLLDRPVFNLPDLMGLIGERQAFHSGQLLVDRFEIVKLLGRGGMGEVYEAIDRQHPEVVAIKTIRTDLSQDRDIRERFRTEVQRSRQVSHPNICRVHELFSVDGEDDGALFFSMEMVHGETLHQRVRRAGPLSLPEALAVAQQVCAGISAAHKAGLVHRDLKSSNILLAASDSPEGVEVKITDFGLARELPSDGDTIRASFVDSPSGTLAYMAPELLEGRRANKATDLYALGIVFYRMVTGRYPFEAQADLVSAAMRLRHPAPSPRKHVPRLPRTWERAILACLAGNPRHRPSDALVVAGLLQSDASAIWARRAQIAGLYLTRRRLLMGGVLLGSGVGFGTIWNRWHIPPYAHRPVHILVQDFESSDPGGALGRAVRNMVKLAYFRSSHLRIVRPDAVAAASKDLNIGTEPMRGDVALRAAKRCGAELTIRGHVVSSGQGFQLQLEAIRVANGAVLVRAGESAVSYGQLGAAVERVCSRTAIDLVGPAKAGLQGEASDLQPADTIRPDALESFTSGLAFFRYGEIRVALDHLQNATRIEPDFALAYVYQAVVHGALRREDLAFPAIARAFALREKLSNRQRLETEALYANFCGDWNKSLDAQRILVANYPNEAHLQRQIAHTCALLNRTDDAISHARIATKLDPRGAVNYMILGSTLAQSGAFSEAHQILERGRLQAPDSPVLLLSEATVQLLEDHPDKALSLLEPLERNPDYASHTRSERVRCFLLSGRLSEARAQLQSDLLLNEVDGDAAHEDLSRYWMSQVLNLHGDPEAVEQSRRLASRPAEPYALFPLRASAETAFEAAAPEPLNTAVSKLRKVQSAYPGRRLYACLQQGEGFQAGLAGDRPLAAKLLARAYDLCPDVANTFYLAQVLFKAGLLERALSLYQSVIARKGIAIRLEQQVHWVRSHALAARCLTRLGRHAEAATSYETFLRYWGSQVQLLLVKQVLAERVAASRKEGGQREDA